jgi:hypothetical protein
MTLLDRLPLAEDILPGPATPAQGPAVPGLRHFVLWNKPGSEATVRADITETTPRAVSANPGQAATTTPAPTNPNPWGI